MLKQRTILSPINGVIIDRYKSAGEYVEREPLLRVAQLDPLHIEIFVTADHWGRFLPGQQAEVTPLFMGLDKKVATIEKIDPVIDSASGTFRVQLQLPNPEHRIAAGLKCQLAFLPQKADIIIPTNALTSSEPKRPINSCFTVGPVVVEKIAQQLTEQFVKQSPKITVQQESRPVVNGYFVHSVPLVDLVDLVDLAEFHAEITHLKAARFNDYVVNNDNESNRHWLSLGHFQKRENALNRAKKITAMGVEVELKPDHQKNSAYWLNLSGVNSVVAENGLRKAVAHLDPLAEVKPISCEPLLASKKQ